MLLTLTELDAADPDQMYRGLLELPWEAHVRPDGTFAVDVVGEPPRWLRHTQFAALRAKDAIVDRMRETAGARPSVDLATPDLRVSLRFARERVYYPNCSAARAAGAARVRRGKPRYAGHLDRGGDGVGCD